MHPKFQQLRDQRIVDLERRIDYFYYKLIGDLEKAKRKGRDDYQNLFASGVSRLLGYYEALSQLKALKPIEGALCRVEHSIPVVPSDEGRLPVLG